MIEPIIIEVYCWQCENCAFIDGEYVCMARGELVERYGYCHKGKLRGKE